MSTIKIVVVIDCSVLFAGHNVSIKVDHRQRSR